MRNLLNVHHILIGKTVTLNSNIIRCFSTYYREMETEEDDHFFHILQNKAALGADELPYFEQLSVSADRLVFIQPTRINILRLLLRVRGDDLILIHSGRMNDLFLMLSLTPWLWKRTALICFGNEVALWKRIAAARGWKNRLFQLSQWIVVPRLRAVCTLTPGEYDLLRPLFAGANNYQRAFLATSHRVDAEVLDRRMSGSGRTTRVMLNQSANIGGRHREALEWLSKFRNEDITVTCPVAFGEEAEAEAVIQAGRDCLGEKFSYIKDKMLFDDYSRMVKDKMDILVLNHLGQSGLGHLYMFLCTGKSAYIRSETPVYDFLKEIDIEVRATDSIPGMSFEEFTRPLTRESAEKNIHNFNRHLSTEASVESCRRLIRIMREGHE